MIRETTEMIVQIKNRLLAARSRQKSYADVRQVSPWKGVVRFGKHGKLSPPNTRKEGFVRFTSPNLHFYSVNTYMMMILRVFWIGYGIRLGLRSLKIIMENLNSPNELNEAIPEENPVIPEPKYIGDAHDPNERVDIPNDEELEDYAEDDEEEL
ncbi:hypothetical protein Tco_0781806 [Tanacetum coccineum]